MTCELWTPAARGQRAKASSLAPLDRKTSRKVLPVLLLVIPSDLRLMPLRLMVQSVRLDDVTQAPARRLGPRPSLKESVVHHGLGQWWSVRESHSLAWIGSVSDDVDQAAGVLGD